ncbi:uncharacterized protein LOC115573802 [Sparus aurata]|uniref:uncharacterized protein LOC115573802 n=1 Tax=Sparus aurata TaxID=8175 RepID=UPI0011C0FFF2|nr:uncharacterized protein LOC115573802 [Sparus aurata]
MGPYTVVKRVSDLNYLISTPGRRKSVKLFHVNLLKPYYAHSPSASVADQQGSVAVSPALVVGTVGGVLGECLDGVLEPDEGVLSGRLKNSETLKNLKGLDGHLPEEYALEFEELILKYPCLFGDVPSCTDWAEHDIDVGETLPIRQHFYRVSPEKRKYLDAEVKYMLENNIAVPSFSSWASPCLLVPKSDGTPRFCSDFRKVNKVTKPDSFPLPRMEDCVDQVDASHVGAGAVLVQADEQGVDRPVSFFSKKFNRHQVNYSVVEKEALALVWALQHFAVYVESGVAPVVVYTDHNPLTFLHSLRCPNQRLIRWSLFLQSCNLDIRHIKGRDNVVADALSRAPVME